MDMALARRGEVARLARLLAVLALAALIAAPGCAGGTAQSPQAPASAAAQPSASPVAAAGAFDYADVPAYEGAPFVTINGNAPYFRAADFEGAGGIALSPLDALGRAGAACAVVGPGTVADSPRGSLATVPSGFAVAKYDWIAGKYLYNRCHLVAYKLSGIGDEPRDLITGTRYLNVDGMQPYERAVQSHVERTGRDVLYRVTPVFLGDELVARGVLVEAASLDDEGASFGLCAWCYNVQPGIEIDYATGDNKADGTVEESGADASDYKYLVNEKSRVFHLPDCPTGSTTKESNRSYSNDSRDELIEQGYAPCGNCKP